MDRKSIQELLDQSNRIRRGEKQDPDTVFQLAKALAGRQKMEAARRLAQHLSTYKDLEPALALRLHQLWALWTSKNPDAPDDRKHTEALAILDAIRTVPDGESLESTTNEETLGIAGGICKRRWQVDGRRESLEDSLAYYERGVRQGVRTDKGYTAINAAFVNDLLASLADDSVPTERAVELRKQVLDELPPIEEQPAYEGGPLLSEERWFHETIAEAQFGLEQFDAASERLGRVDWSAVEPWELETTARQFASLAKLLSPGTSTAEAFEASPAWKVLRENFGGDVTKGAGSLFAGKLGVALSGGGFRASLFHIGVLAALAEKDMLRHVEVMSCVSGGSILGAHYYLEVRKLLQENVDGSISRAQYIELVERLASDFLAGVKKNIRMRIATSVVANLKMMLLPGYTRTSRLAELYEEHLYARVKDDGERRLRKLMVQPMGASENFNPKYDNWKRADKVPILILNSTCVNTGHNWQFTASWMGEPPAQIESRIDGNYRLRRMYLESEAPPQHRDISIGDAAAASACVPGLFTPLELRNLYPGIIVRLVDGGVHDNQGVFGLMDQNCTVMVVSDASGQMSAVDEPSDGGFSTLLRTNSMVMARVRSAEYRELEARYSSGLIKDLLFLHLKSELPVRDHDWANCENPKQLTGEDLRRATQELARYGILKSEQAKIADIRTDLDSFSDAEAFALMTSGCQMIRTQFDEDIHGFPVEKTLHDWEFLKVLPDLASTGRAESSGLGKLLEVASKGAFKIWHLSKGLKYLSWGLGLLVLLAMIAIVWFFRGEPFFSLEGLLAWGAGTVLLLLIGALGLGTLAKTVQYEKTAHQILIGAALCVVGWIGSWTHLTFFDKWFLDRGKLDGK